MIQNSFIGGFRGISEVQSGNPLPASWVLLILMLATQITVTMNRITDALTCHNGIHYYAVPAIPIVAVTVGVRYKYYGVRGACGDLL